MTLISLSKKIRNEWKDAHDVGGIQTWNEMQLMYLESIIIRTCHATKEEVRGMIEEEILAYEIENSRGTGGTPYNYGVQGGLSALQGILSALEDTTTSHTN